MFRIKPPSLALLTVERSVGALDEIGHHFTGNYSRASDADGNLHAALAGVLPALWCSRGRRMSAQSLSSPELDARNGSSAGGPGRR